MFPKLVILSNNFDIPENIHFLFFSFNIKIEIIEGLLVIDYSSGEDISGFIDYTLQSTFSKQAGWLFS